jgi:sugar lactone lactonase YvrE
MKTKFLIGLLTASALVIGLGGAARADDAPNTSTVASWNSLPYALSAKAEAAWKASAEYGKTLLQGVKVDSEGNIYVTTARWGGPGSPATLSKLVKTSKGWALKPYPSEEFNAMSNPDGLKAVLGFEIDRNDVMWILDQGHVGGKPSNSGDEKLVLWDIKTNKELARYNFTNSEADYKCSFLNDVVVDNDSGFSYITDSGIMCNPLKGGLIVYNRATNTVRRVLDSSPVTNNDPNFYFMINGQPVTPGGAMLTGADGIALAGDKQTLYWTDLTGHTLYSLPTKLLQDFNTPEATIAASVKTVATLPSNTDGMTADREGNIYLTALTLDGIMKYDTKTGQLTKLLQNTKIDWPDTMGWGPGGALYFSTGHLNLWVSNAMNFKNPKVPNFSIMKVDLHETPYLAK